MGYVVTAGRVTVLTAVPGGRAYVDVRRGEPLPPDVPTDQVTALLDRGDVEQLLDVAHHREPVDAPEQPPQPAPVDDQAAVETPPPHDPPAPSSAPEITPTPPVGDLELVDQVPAGSVADVLAWVGNDLERAAAALTAEQARGDKARKTLVAQLAELVAEQTDEGDD